MNGRAETRGRRALITGIAGQDGAYLSRLLVDKGYRVYGLLARRSNESLWRLRELGLEDKVTLLVGDVTDLSSILRALEEAEPAEFYNLAAQSTVTKSWDLPSLTAQVTGTTAAIREEGLGKLVPIAESMATIMDAVRTAGEPTPRQFEILRLHALAIAATIQENEQAATLVTEALGKATALLNRPQPRPQRKAAGGR